MAALGRMLGKVSVSPVRLGIAFIVVSLVIGGLLFQKARIGTMLRPGDSISIQFEDKIGLREFISDVKVAGVPVGKVSSIDRERGDLTEVTVKVDTNIPDLLGSAPTARVRTTTLLGGNYYVELRPGGAPGRFEGTIPVDRTSHEVELDEVVAALQPNARRGIQSSVRNLDATLAHGGAGELRNLARNAPRTLGPGAEVLHGLRGTRPDTDLTDLVTGLEGVSRALSAKDVQLDGMVGDLRATTDVLARRGADLAALMHTLPSTLRSADEGLERLDVSLGKARDAADPVRPAVDELGDLLERADPVLAEAVPVVHDLRGVVDDLRPVVGDLVPTSRTLTDVFDDVHGPVLERANGPIMNVVKSPYQGTGKYAATRGDRPFFQELAFMVANLDRAAEMRDKNGSMIAFEPGVGPGSAAGLPISLERLFTQTAQPREGGR